MPDGDFDKGPSYVDGAFEHLRSILTEQIVEIAINPDGTIWTEQQGDAYMTKTDLVLPKTAVEQMCRQMSSGGSVRMSPQHPLGSASIDYQDWLVRAQIIQAPAVRMGHSLSLRFFKPKTQLFEPAYLDGTPKSASAARRELNERVAELATTDLLAALKLCVREKLNLVVSGGTNTGKTTVARWLISNVDDRERIITIEDTPDLMPQQPNKVMLVSDRESDVRGPDKLLQATLRMRPDRIILSEVTGADAYTFLKAINTGHGGSITTVHAETAELAIERLAQTALESGVNMMYRDMISYVQRSIDIIVQVGKRDGKRGVMEVYLPENFDPTDRE
ncbi:MAG: ATPase, T2SS/T4P/T4SS family [Pseudomonadota bacterium]